LVEAALLARAWRLARRQGPGALIVTAKSRLWPRRVRGHRGHLARLAGGLGLEIGGPSALFDHLGLLPAYAVAGRVDNCNFGHETVWEGALTVGMTFKFDRGRRLGVQYIAEATDLQPIAPETYDFVLSSHAIEHVANPLGALKEWSRVLKPGGHLVLFAPHKDGTFDHRRPVTALAHLMDDFRAGVGEDDLTHLGEILALHDLAMDPEAGSFESFERRSRRNVENRCLHHHVFDTALASEMVASAGFELLAEGFYPPGDIFVMARKPDGTARP
jgi:SAM-dependent methyltransferase